MSRPARTTMRPDAERILGGLKDFQRATVDYAFHRMYEDHNPAHRFLVADEVGLGKTMVARGIVACAIDHLWDKVDRVDVIYICSNGDIARQNIRRLNVFDSRAMEFATRLTMLPRQLGQIDAERVNFISFTPGTSFNTRAGLGQVQERVLLYALVRELWSCGSRKGPRYVFSGTARIETFDYWLKDFDRSKSTISPTVVGDFVNLLEDRERKLKDRREPTLRERFDQASLAFTRSHRTVSPDERTNRGKLIGELRHVLAATCVKALQPDLIILDEFQRFKDLLGDDDETAAPGALLAQELFNYEEGTEKARVLLLSATPYKMFTTVDEAGGEDHYADFVQTLQFLAGDRAYATDIRQKFGNLRRALLQGVATSEELSLITGDIQNQLRRFIARTERLAVTSDRSGMLREQVCNSGIALQAADARAYCSLAALGQALSQPSILEYWKSAPYVVSMMDEYELKQELRTELKADPRNGAAGILRAAAKQGVELSLSRETVEAQKPLSVPHPRMRWLLEDTVEREAWKLLWIPPSVSYYRMEGAFNDPALRLFTKRLVFSAWQVVPKSIATVVSYEAERRMLQSQRREGESRSDQIERTKALLHFTRSAGRLTGMPVLALCYPSVTLSDIGDPLRLVIGNQVETIDYATVKQRCVDALKPLVQPIVSKAPVSGPEDERWYWAAPLLLDSMLFAQTRSWLARDKAALLWLGGGSTDGAEDQAERDISDEQTTDIGQPDGRGWRDHAREAQRTVEGILAEPLGVVPADLLHVLAELAIAGPANCALRALTRGANDEVRAEDTIRDAAGSIGHAFRTLFNSPDVQGLLRAEGGNAPYWRRVLDYTAAGCLQGVLDEYVHVLRESEGVASRAPEVAAPVLALKIREALATRTSSLKVDEVKVSANHMVGWGDFHMRSRFAMRFATERSEAGEEVTRAESVRAAFNSPFWPFVLASTSVGQEGLDFHHYCHAVVHWNLPSNPVDMEQREGRVHRYKGHAVRRNVARAHAKVLSRWSGGDPWHLMFEAARSGRRSTDNDLVPFWVYPIEGGAYIERHVPSLPLSRDSMRHAAIRKAVAVYRMAFGQPRQEELVDYLVSISEQSANAVSYADFVIDLSPSASAIRQPTRA